MLRRNFCLAFVLLTGAAHAQPDDPNPFPARAATAQDAQLLSTKFASLKPELARMGLRQTTGRTCTDFITADSVRPIETPFPLDGATVTLPYASFLVWSANRPYADAVLYHVFADAGTAYAQPQKLPAGTTKANQAYDIVLAKREPYPTAAEVARTHDALAAGPFTDLGLREKVHALAAKPYVLPAEKDDPASVLPRKAERTLQVTCLADPDRVTNCLCAGTE